MKKIAGSAVLALAVLVAAVIWLGPWGGDRNAVAGAAGAVDGSATVLLRVENMSCPACPFTVRRAIKGVDGTIDVDVDYRGKTAKVIYDPQRTNARILAQAATNAGYPSTPM